MIRGEGRLMGMAVKLVVAAHKEIDDAMPEKLAKIVKLHSALAVGAAWVPVPGVDIAACAANIWTMYYRINSELNMPFGENVVKSLASGVVTNVSAGYLGIAVV